MLAVSFNQLLYKFLILLIELMREPAFDFLLAFMQSFQILLLQLFRQRYIVASRRGRLSDILDFI